MTRVLLLMVIAYLVWLGIESLLNRLRAFGAPPAHRTGPRRAASNDAQGIETLVRCTACGVHVSRSRILTQGGEPYCSEECRRRAAQSA
ncbi:MAG TPA: PP0621 family protein [Thermoanaerobaculia bacterium]|jgi:hypothetical protein|nr:PP0621 family protein [Thermoanaerobaculia bacterium]